MKAKPHQLIIILIILLSLILGACSRTDPMPTAESTDTSTPTRTNTMTPSPTNTRTATATISPTSAPTDTATPTPTETVQWDGRGLSLTPLPVFLDVITANNVEAVDAIAVWGNGRANTLALSVDSRLLAVGTGIGVYLYESVNFLLLNIFTTPYAVQSIAFSPDNQTIALGQSLGTIDVFDLDRQTLISRLAVSDISFSETYRMTVNFSQGGRFLTSLIADNNNLYVNRWDTFTWQQVLAFTVPEGLVAYINTPADLLGIIDGSSLILQSLASADDRSEIPLPTSEPASFWQSIPMLNGEVEPAPNGEFILINNGTSVLQWQLTEETATFKLDQYPAELPDPCLQAPNTCRNTQGSFSWTCDGSSRLPPVETIRLTPDSAALLVSLNDGRSEFRQSNNGALLWRLNTHFTDVRFASSMDFFMGLRPDGSIEKRSMDDGELINILRQHPSQLFALDFSPDGSFLAAGYNDGWIRVYSTTDGKMLGVLDGSATALQFSPDGARLAAGLTDGTVRVYEIEEKSFFNLLNGHLAAVTDLVYSADGSSLLTGSDDCTASLWDVDGRFRQQNIKPGGTTPFQIKAVELANESADQFILAKENGIFQVTDSQISALFTPENTRFGDIALSPDGQVLAAAGLTGWLISTDAEGPEAEQLSFAPPANNAAQALAFTPSGEVLIIAAAQGLTFWSVPEGVRLADLTFTPAAETKNLPIDLTLSPDGSLLALAKGDGLIYIFAVRP